MCPFDQPLLGQPSIPSLAKDTTEEHPWPVSKVSHVYGDTISKWPSLWLEGEIAEINTRRFGSAYITLTDSDTSVNISISITAFGPLAMQAKELNQGDHIIVHGNANIYSKQTSLSFRADKIIQKKDPQASLKDKINRLRQQLEEEGLFDESRKIALPRFPQCIGIVCAKGSRAESDIVNNASLRWPTIRFKIEDAHVQGAQCAATVIQGIQTLDADPDVDVIIVARGGGSFEDLIHYSDEDVVRAIAACETPIVSAIGHEDDWPIADRAVDLRCSTPTDAAKRVVPDVKDESELVDNLYNKLMRYLGELWRHESTLIAGYVNRPSLISPTQLLENPRRIIEDYSQRLSVVMYRLLDDNQNQCDRLQSNLRVLSPQSVLNRGYSIVMDKTGHSVAEAESLTVDDPITILLQHGRITATVTDIHDHNV